MREEVFSMSHVTTDDYEMTNLDNMTMRIFKGEIAGLLPVNEQGRKKLLEVMQNNIPLHYGRVYMDGQMVNSYLKSSQHSNQDTNRVYVISSKNRLVRDLTVYDNLFVLRKGFRLYILTPKILGQQAGLLLEQTGLSISPDEMVDELSEFERVVVELVKAVLQRAKLIVLDEISAILSMSDIHKLIRLMQHYTKQGFSFLYIGNHHEEVLSLCERTMIMKNGRIIKVVQGHDIPDEEVLLVAGAEGYPELYLQLEHMTPQEREEQSLSYCESALEFKNVGSTYLQNLSFSVYPGECVILLDRNTPFEEELKKILLGEDTSWQGEIICGKKRLTHEKRIHPLDDSIGVIQEYAYKSMVFPHLTFLENLCIMADRKVSSVFLQKNIRKSVRKEYGEVFGDNLDETDMRNVSKEDKYTLVYYRYYMLRPKVVFCIRPFSGADMYLRRHILELIQKLKQRGIAVVILTASLADSYFVADRLLMLERGKLTGEFHKEDFKYLWDDLLQNK